MHHADSSLVPPDISSKPEFWSHVRAQLQCLLAGQRRWVTNLANASSLISHSLLAFPPHFGAADRAVNWCGEFCLLITRARQRIQPGEPPFLTLLFAGFYLLASLFPEPRVIQIPSTDQPTPTTNDEDTLFLGPFCGKPACQFINLSPDRPRGVCAAAFVRRQTVLVPNVHEYPGHIACDGDTQSEIVCPLILRNGTDHVVLGVLDLDCLALGAFDEEDKLGLEAIADLIVNSCDW